MRRVKSWVGIVLCISVFSIGVFSQSNVSLGAEAPLAFCARQLARGTEWVANLGGSENVVKKLGTLFWIPVPLPVWPFVARIDLLEMSVFEKSYTADLALGRQIDFKKIVTREQKIAVVTVAFKKLVGSELGLEPGDRRLAEAVLRRVRFNGIFRTISYSEVFQIVDSILDVAGTDRLATEIAVGDSWGRFSFFKAKALEQVEAEVQGAFSRSIYPHILEDLVRVGLRRTWPERVADALPEVQVDGYSLSAPVRQGLDFMGRISLYRAENPWIVPIARMALVNGILIYLGVPEQVSWPIYMLLPMTGILGMRAYQYLPLSSQVASLIEKRQPLQALQKARETLGTKGYSQAFLEYGREAYIGGIVTAATGLVYASVPFVKAGLGYLTLDDDKEKEPIYNGKKEVEADLQGWIALEKNNHAGDPGYKGPTDQEIAHKRAELEEFERLGGYHRQP